MMIKATKDELIMGAAREAEIKRLLLLFRKSQRRLQTYSTSSIRREWVRFEQPEKEVEVFLGEMM